MAKAYNIWVVDEKRWSTFVVYQSQDSHNPKRYSLNELKPWYDQVFGSLPEMNKIYVIVEMDGNNNPILPRCLQ